MPYPRQTTIVDIANQLGISPSTVSRALNDHPGISLQTKIKVRNLANEKHYNPNRLAQSLLQKRTGIIGIVVPEITSNFFSTAINGVQDMVNKAGYKLLICQSNESIEEEKKLIKDLINLRMDGIIISPAFEITAYDHLQHIQQAGIPLVIFDRDCPNFASNKVMIDNYQTAYQAVEYLINKGCKAISHIIGPLAFPTFKQRHQAYVDAHQANNRIIDANLITEVHDFSLEAGKDAMETILRNNTFIDGLFSVNDTTAFGAMQILRDSGYEIPNEIAIIGFDDDPYATFSTPSLSTIWQPTYEMGMLSAKIILDYYDHTGATLPFRHEILKSELILRESTNTLVAEAITCSL